MGLAELLAALEDDAQAEIALLDHDTRDQARELVAEAEREGRALHSDPVQAAEARADAEALVVTSSAHLEALRILRGAREVAFRVILDDLQDRLAALRDDSDYQVVLGALVHESLGALPAGRTLRVDPRDAAIASGVLRELGRRDVTVDPCLCTLGGVELASDDGRLVRNTLEERLANAGSELRLRLAAAAARASASEPELASKPESGLASKPESGRASSPESERASA